jgi:hypothetical protein
LIRQRFLLYIAAGTVAAAACPRRLEPVVPVSLELAPTDSAIAWARRTLPVARGAIQFRWRYQDERLRWSGRGAARLAPPDSLRLDYVGSLGVVSGAGVVVGDSVVWAEPHDDFRRLVPAIPMLWAALGAIRPPATDAAVFTRRVEADGRSVRYWRFALGVDTLDYALWSGSAQELEAEWRRNSRVVARSRTRYDERSRPATSRIDFPGGPARLELTVVGVDTAAVFPPLLWRRRR